MMKRWIFLAAGLLTAACPIAARAAAPGSPEDVVERALESLNRGRLDAFVKAMHPDALERFRAAILETVDLAAARGKQAQVLEPFQGVATVEELKALDAAGMFTALLAKAVSSPEAKQALASTRIEALGRVAEGKEKAYVVYRSRMKLGDLPVDRLNAAAVVKSGQAWKLALSDEAAGQIAALKAGLADAPAAPDPAATKVEPLGHVPEGKRSALVVFRAVVPVGDSSIDRLSVLAVGADDPGWDVVRKGEKGAVANLIADRLGIPRPPTPEEEAARKARAEALMERARAQMEKMPKPRQPTPEDLAALKAESKQRLEEMRARLEKRPGGAPAGDPKARGPRDAAGAEAPLPEGLAAVPASFFGGDRDRFFEVAPEGGVLAGVRVSYIMRFGGPKISSIRPVFRVGSKLVDGKRRGTLLGEETSAVAREGYAVGAVRTHTGLTVDGFDLVFMKIDGDRLDPADSYDSPWLGDEKGGSPRDAASDGKIPVGLQGRAGREVNALGLIVKE